VAGISTAGFNLNYSKSSPDLPDTANLNSISGEFVWTKLKLKNRSGMTRLEAHQRVDYGKRAVEAAVKMCERLK